MRNLVRTAALPVLSFTLHPGCAERGSLGLAGDDSDLADTMDTADTALPGGDCGEEIVTSVPLDGATGQPAGTPVRVTFNVPPNRAAVRVRVRVDARDVPGEVLWSEDGLTATFEPLQEIVAGARHELRVTWACGESITTFTPARAVWSVVLDDATQTTPSGVDLLPALGTQLLALDGVSRDGLTFTLAPAEGGRQDACGVTASGQGPRSDESVAAWTFTRGALALSDRLAPAAQITVSGRLNAVGGTLGAVSLQARVQVADLAAALEEDPDDVCSDLTGNACAPCPAPLGLTGRCVLLTLDEIAVRPSDATVVSIAAGDIGPGCR